MGWRALTGFSLARSSRLAATLPCRLIENSQPTGGQPGGANDGVKVEEVSEGDVTKIHLEAQRWPRIS